MRRLIIGASRRVEFDDQRAMLKQRDHVFILGPRKTSQRLPQIDLLTGFVAHGDGANNTLQCAARSKAVIAMERDELVGLAGDSEFISGIYNYCDRWCERCQFTSRCFLYATEQADSDLDDPEVRDIRN